MQSDQFQLHSQIEQRHWWFVARRQILCDLVHRLVPPQQDAARQATVIDVGCGTGANAAALAGEYHSVGIDTCPEAIHLAAQRFPAVDFRAGFAPDDLTDCMPEAKLIMLNDVLEHVEDDRELLSKLIAAARPGTYFLITVPADMALWSQHDVSFGHYRRYDEQQFEHVWKDLPVERKMLSHFNARLYPIIRAIRTRNRRRGHTTGQAGTDFEMPRAVTNRMLTKIFAGERKRLHNLLEGRTQRAYGAGASLIAILQRTQVPKDVTTMSPCFLNATTTL